MAETIARRSSLERALVRVASLSVQIGLVRLSDWLAFLLRFDLELPASIRPAFWQGLPWLVAVRAVAIVLFRLNDGVWRYTSTSDVRAILGAVVVSTIGFGALTELP